MIRQPGFPQRCGRHETFEEHARFRPRLVLLQDTMRVGACHAAIKASARQAGASWWTLVAAPAC